MKKTRRTRGWFVQLFNYLKAGNGELGLLVNMGPERVVVERVIYRPPDTRLDQNWEQWQHSMIKDDREVALAIQHSLRQVYAEHTTGYGEHIVRNLVLSALRQTGLRVRANPLAPAVFRQHDLGLSPLKCWIIADRFVLTLTALQASNRVNVKRGLAYLKALGLKWGVAVNFGKKVVEFTGLQHKN